MSEPACKDRHQSAGRTTSGSDDGGSRRTGGSSASERGGLPLGLDRIALAPVHAAARSTAGILAGEVERAIDAVFAGPLPEAFGRSLGEHRVVERVVVEALETASPDRLEADELDRLVGRIVQSPALERWVESGDAGRLTETVVERLIRSAAFRRALTEALSSPEVRSAVAEQTAGFAADVAKASRGNARRLDDTVEGWIHRLLRRSRRAEPSRFGGIATRGAGLVLDAALVLLGLVVATASVALVLAIVGASLPGWLAETLMGVGLLLAGAAYLVAFWSLTGQTPGMRVMRLRVVTGQGQRPSLLRSSVRFVGLVLAIVPWFAGFLPVLVDGRRRSLPDFLARTLVVYEPDDDEAGAQLSAAPVVDVAQAVDRSQDPWRRSRQTFRV